MSRPLSLLELGVTQCLHPDSLKKVVQINPTRVEETCVYCRARRGPDTEGHWVEGRVDALPLAGYLGPEWPHVEVPGLSELDEADDLDALTNSVLAGHNVT